MSVSPWISVFIPVSVTVLLAVTLLLFFGRRRRRSLRGRHVVITGGSSGIGKALVKRAAEEGANVTIVARNWERLARAKEEVGGDGTNVQAVSADLTAGQEEVRGALDGICRDFGPVFMLVNCAGRARAARFEEARAEDFGSMMDVNYLGSVRATRALLPSLRSSSDGGAVVFVSSQAGLVGVYGFSAYSAAKFALRGMAESLSMELEHAGITVTVSFPPDTDTPGFEEEERDKPEETKLISQTSGLFQADDVAK